MTRKPDKPGASSYFISSNPFILAALVGGLVLSGCASVNAQFSPAKPHHTPEGFKNNYATSVTKSTGDFSAGSLSA